ncbi:hypothetical protein [Variovorax sp. Sphag1AA]|uniref:hypothetical protein n=1 Tax=Variovorax sp. Sphag1AA TaxID=2587027 RepID=UPI00178E93F1|nr:hypothetical protein [Variovorax sp. Sphag1AA]MBB3182241.1 hypothetical protein [Variovorax sp. Sphag1AA]
MPRRLRIASLVSSALLLFGSASVCAEKSAQSTPKRLDKLSEMFVWWNDAMKTPGALTEAGFAKYFTADAPLVIDGVEATRGPDGWANHFQNIQAAVGPDGRVETVVPFRYVFQKDDRIYTYHVIRSRAHGMVSCMLAAGHADLKGGRINKVTLVRAEIDPASDPDCWKK